MSILQIEVSEEKRLEWEARAAAQGRDLQTWAMERLLAPDEKEEDERRYVEGELLKALDSGPGEVADDAWWRSLEADALAAPRGKQA